jgi:hypothetical protein
MVDTTRAVPADFQEARPARSAPGRPGGSIGVGLGAGDGAMEFGDEELEVAATGA